MAVSNPQTAYAARPHPGWVPGLTSTAYPVVVPDPVVVITALPRMQHDLHAGLASLQWTLTADNIAFAAGIITAAAAGDRSGRRRICTTGLAVFTVAPAARALAPHVPALIAARTVQGLGAAIILPLSLTIVTTAFPAGRQGMTADSYGGLAGLAVAMGPIAGGAITQATDWHRIFCINVPIGSPPPPPCSPPTHTPARPQASPTASSPRSPPAPASRSWPRSARSPSHRRRHSTPPTRPPSRHR